MKDTFSGRKVGHKIIQLHIKNAERILNSYVDTVNIVLKPL